MYGGEGGHYVPAILKLLPFNYKYAFSRNSNHQTLDTSVGERPLTETGFGRARLSLKGRVRDSGKSLVIFEPQQPIKWPPIRYDYDWEMGVLPLCRTGTWSYWVLLMPSEPPLPKPLHQRPPLPSECSARRRRRRPPWPVYRSCPAQRQCQSYMRTGGEDRIESLYCHCIALHTMKFGWKGENVYLWLENVTVEKHYPRAFPVSSEHETEKKRFSAFRIHSDPFGFFHILLCCSLVLKL